MRAAHVENNSIGSQLVVTFDVRANVRSVPGFNILFDLAPIHVCNVYETSSILANALMCLLFFVLNLDPAAVGAELAGDRHKSDRLFSKGDDDHDHDKLAFSANRFRMSMSISRHIGQD